MKAQIKRRLSRKPESAKSNAGTKRRERCVYFGQQLLGTFVENERSGLVLAWNPQRRFLGRFLDSGEAARAIGEAARATESKKVATEEALERINRTDVEFASGLSADLVDGWRRR